MFKTQDELKAFIIWAKEQKIQRIKIDKIEVEISNLAFIDGLEMAPLRQPATIKPVPSSDKEPAKAEETEDPDLFWSVSN